METIPLIPQPCQRITWREMAGDDRVRHCELCARQVVNLEGLAPEEIERAREASGGKLCGYLGGATTMPRTRRAVVVGALLTAISPLFAEEGTVRFVIVDPRGAPVTRAVVARVDKDGKPLEVRWTDGEGKLVWTGLPLGEARFRVSSPRPGIGFKELNLVAVISGTQEQTIRGQFEGGINGEVVTATGTFEPGAKK